MENQEMPKEKKTLKIVVNDEIFNSANATLKELRARGSNAKIDDLFEELLKSVSGKYWEDQLQKHTPDDYLFELAKQNPEARMYLIQQARRALDAVNRGESLTKDRKKPGPKPKSKHTESSL